MLGLVELGRAVRETARAAAAKPAVYLAAGFFCILCVLPRSPAEALTVGPGEALEVEFSFASAPALGGPAVDFFALVATPIVSSGPGILLSSQLFDGDVLLGGGTRPISALIPFTAPGGLYNGMFADLAPVADGSIDGRVVIAPIFPGDTGFLTVDPAVIYGRAGHGVSATGVMFASPFPTIGAVRVVAPPPPVAHTPLPAAWLLFLSAVACLGATRLRRLFSRRGILSSSA